VRTVLVALAAVLITLAVAAAGGWFKSTRTVVVPEAVHASPVAAPVRSASIRPGSGLSAPALYAARSPGVVTIYAEFGSTEAQGSGFVVTRTGLILTSSHVITTAGEQTAGTAVARAAQVYVEFADGDRVQAQIVGYDVFDDVGLIKVDPKTHALHPVPLGRSSAVRVGQPVAVIGSPFGNENSFDVGVVSGIHRSIDSLTSTFRLDDAIQIDAPITHGNSGGPVFDAQGRVIGIAAQIRTDTGQAEGVGFAVPIESARRSLVQLVSTGRVSYAFVGVRTTDLTPNIARALGLPVSSGALVVKVDSGSAAARAGLRQGSSARAVDGVSIRAGGDVVLSVAGHPIRSGEDLAWVVSEQLHPGQTVTFTILRGGRRLEIPVRLGSRTG
jgi:S1-C subfamily serine protease